MIGESLKQVSISMIDVTLLIYFSKSRESVAIRDVTHTILKISE